MKKDELSVSNKTSRRILIIISILGAFLGFLRLYYDYSLFYEPKLRNGLTLYYGIVIIIFMGFSVYFKLNYKEARRNIAVLMLILFMFLIKFIIPMEVLINLY